GRLRAANADPGSLVARLDVVIIWVLQHLHFTHEDVERRRS
ncbi:unnamed protein product, partial [Amoebophrya sp. A120]